MGTTKPSFNISLCIFLRRKTMKHPPGEDQNGQGPKPSWKRHKKVARMTTNGQAPPRITTTWSTTSDSEGDEATKVPAPQPRSNNTTGPKDPRRRPNTSVAAGSTPATGTMTRPGSEVHAAAPVTVVAPAMPQAPEYPQMSGMNPPFSVRVNSQKSISERLTYLGHQGVFDWPWHGPKSSFLTTGPNAMVITVLILQHYHKKTMNIRKLRITVQMQLK
jgi:hypothetical protein